MLEITVIALFAVTFLVQPFRIPSESMVPTLRVGDFLLVDKQSYAPQGRLDHLLMPPTPVQRGDLVVFHYPVDLTLHLVKRVVGLPGDRIHLRDGHLLVNDQPLPEPYALYIPSRPNNFRDSFPSLREADPNIDPLWWATLRRIDLDGEITVPPNHYFVMGDNRNNSEDSRYWGFLPQTHLVGRPLVVYFSLADDASSPEPPPATPLARFFDRYRTAFRSMRILH
jgi:signal peptidase I